MPQATHQDAMVLLQIGQLGAAQGIPAAMNWIFSDAFIPDYDDFIKKFPRGSDHFGQVRRAATYHETIGTLWKHKLINEDLLFDWLWVDGVWNRLKGFVVGQRKHSGNPAIGENFEAMAQAGRAWQDKRTSPSARKRGKAR